ncbi:MAG: prolyl oligopeptidase family serine peptidase [Alphaproteobacteria bacterium]|nr:prolyl oligopeptidase family serine peptidase [Alphaproteobacteria bacterium]
MRSFLRHIKRLAASIFASAMIFATPASALPAEPPRKSTPKGFLWKHDPQNKTLEPIEVPINLSRAFNPPYDGTAEILHGHRVTDVFRPLEDMDAPETKQWINRQKKTFEDFVLPAKQQHDQTVDFLQKALPQGTSESMPGKYGDNYFVWQRPPGADRWTLHVRDIETPYAPARALLDPQKIDPTGKTNVSTAGISPKGDIVAYELSVSGSDETTLKFLDVKTGNNLALTYPKFRGSFKWDQDGKGFKYTRPVSDASKSFEVIHHKMGTPPAQDRIIHSPHTPETRSWVYTVHKDDSDENGKYEFLRLTNSETDKNSISIRPADSNQPFREIFPHKKGTLVPFAEIGGKIYARTSYDSPNERIVSIDPDSPSPDNWETIVPENKNDPLTSAFVWHNKIFASYTHDTGDEMRAFCLDGRYSHDVPIPPLSTVSRGKFTTKDDNFLMSIDNFQEDGGIYRYNGRSNTLSLFRKSETPIDLKDAVVKRVFATSKDGTKVPMTVIHAANTKLDGTAATLLYGYGGFNVPLEPGFSSSIAKWVRDGGIYVQANLRGGGEFGEEWYKAGRQDNKQNVFDDFVACAEHLINTGHTSPKRLAIQGGSNGGLLTLATALQRPKLFGAVVSQVPVTDMNRFHIGSYYGYSWKSDYGDPDIKKDFEVAARYSPLHNVPEGFKHPPILIQTDANDDRVQPWHSYKMAATLQSREDESSKTFLNVNTDGGHGSGGSLSKWFNGVAQVRSFLERVLGPINQEEYKKSLQANDNQPPAPAKKKANDKPGPV